MRWWEKRSHTQSFTPRNTNVLFKKKKKNRLGACEHMRAVCPTISQLNDNQTRNLDKKELVSFSN